MLPRIGPVMALLALSLATPLAASAAPAPASPALAPRPLVAFSLVVPSSVAPSGLLARAILPRGVACPPLVAEISDGRKVTRSSRVRDTPGSTSPAFNALRTCEVKIPRDATAVTMGGIGIPAAMPARIDRMAIVGDSGCRIWQSWIQDCTSAQDWPYARIAQRIAQDDPDLIVHMGDFFYREEACPPAQSDLCANSPGPIPGLPFTDTDYSWLADAIVPMAPMFPAAPILALRGNHEECFRGGNGWFLFFDPSWQTADRCAPEGGVAPTVLTDTYAVDLPVRGDRSLRLVVVDSSNGSDTSITPSLQPDQRAAYEAGAALAADAGESWLLTHRPIIGLVTTQYSPPPPTEWTPWTSMDQAAASYGLLDDFGVVIGSHVHVVESVQVPGLPGQFIVGNGGTLLDASSGYAIPPHGQLANASGQPVDPDLTPYPTASRLWVRAQFGYAIATPGRGNGAWRFSIRSVSGDEFAVCRLRAPDLRCADA